MYLDFSWHLSWALFPFFLSHTYPSRQSNKPYILNFTRICALNRSDCCHLLVQGHPKGLWNRLFPCFYIKPSPPPRHRLYSMWTGITKQHYFVWMKKKSETATNELVSRECTLVCLESITKIETLCLSTIYHPQPHHHHYYHHYSLILPSVNKSVRPYTI